MDILTLAETESKPSWQNGIKAFFKQYAVGHNLTETERETFWKEYKFRDILSFTAPVIMMRRRMDVFEDGTVSPREWEYVDCYKSIEDAANDFGETDYFNAMSRHDIHREAIVKWKRSNVLYAEHRDLLAKKNNLHSAYQNMYLAELKSNHLYTGAMKGTDNVKKQNAIAVIRERIRSQYDAERDNISTRISEIEEELKNL